MDNFNLLLNAIKTNNGATIDSICSDSSISTFINKKDYNGNDLLKLAVLHNANLAIIEKLVVAGAKPSKSNSDMLIHTLVDNNINHQVIEYLIDNGVGVNVKDNYGNLAIFKAISKGDVNLLKLLLKKGATPNNKNVVGSHAIPMLFKLSEKVCLEMLDLLLSHDANPNVKDEYGVFALCTAARHQNPKIIELLIKYRPNPNVKDNYSVDVVNLVTKSANFKSSVKVDILTGLHAIGASLEQKDSYGDSAIFSAIKLQQYDVVDCLLKLGANPNAKDVYGNTVLLKLITSDVGLSKYKDLIENALKHGANTNAKDSYGEPLLALAIKRKDLYSVSKLLEYGADLNAKTIYGMALIFQVLDNKEMFREFLKYNVQTKVKNSYGETLESKIKNCSKDIQVLYENSQTKGKIEQVVKPKKEEYKKKPKAKVVEVIKEIPLPKIEVEVPIDYKEKFKNHLRPKVGSKLKK